MTKGKSNITEIQVAADRVRSARTFSAIRQASQSEAELIEAVKAFKAAQDAEK